MNCGQNHFGTWVRSRGEVDGGWRRWVIHRKFNFTSSCILVLSQSLIVKVIFPWNHQISAKCKHHILNKGRRRQKDLLSNGSSLFYFLKWGNWKMLPICIRFHERKKERFMYDISIYFFPFFRLCLNALLTSFVTRCLRVWTLILPWTQTRAHVWIMPNHQVWIAIVNGKSNPQPNTTTKQTNQKLFVIQDNKRRQWYIQVYY